MLRRDYSWAVECPERDFMGSRVSRKRFYGNQRVQKDGKRSAKKEIIYGQQNANKDILAVGGQGVKTQPGQCQKRDTMKIVMLATRQSLYKRLYFFICICNCVHKKNTLNDTFKVKYYLKRYPIL